MTVLYDGCLRMRPPHLLEIRTKSRPESESGVEPQTSSQQQLFQTQQPWNVLVTVGLVGQKKGKGNKEKDLS